MTVTLQDIRGGVLYDLGDNAGAIWSFEEIESYIKEGYDDICGKTEALWETAYLEDEEGVATATIPADLYRIDRASWYYKRLDPLSSAQLEAIDSRYQITQGEVVAYLQDKDGLRTFRKYHVPAADADAYTVTGTWGVARTVTSITAETPTGTWGVLRQVSGEHPISGESSRRQKFWGVPRRFYKELRNTRIEYSRRGQALSTVGAEIELPDCYGKYLRWFALGKALERDGDGQDTDLAGHFRKRWEMAVNRVIKRKAAISANRERQMGGGGQVLGRPPRPRWPWNYGKPRSY